MTNSAALLLSVAAELAAAAMLVRGLALESPRRWVLGRGTGRWSIEPDGDLNYASSSAETGAGFAMLAGGLLMQGMVVLDRDPPTWPFIAAPSSQVRFSPCSRRWQRESSQPGSLTGRAPRPRITLFRNCQSAPARGPINETTLSEVVEAH
jgi:hypothetical protein